MTTVKPSTDSVSQTSNAPVDDGWKDSDHSSIVDFFHKHMPKITDDASKVVNDVNKGLHAVADMAKQGVGAGEDIVNKIKKDGGLKDAMKKAVSEIEEGQNPLKGLISQAHIDAIKADAEKVKENVEKLKNDGKPLTDDIIEGIEKAKGAVGDVSDMVTIAKEMFGGQTPPGALIQLASDAKDIVNQLKIAVQWNANAQSHVEARG